MTRLNLGCGNFPLKEFVNLDARDGWRFEDGLRDFGTDSVEGITISHALMYVGEEHWPAVFDEFARVLCPGGVVRITEDATDLRESERYGGHYDAVTLTSEAKTLAALEAANLQAASVEPGVSGFGDDSLIQNWHGRPPKVFHVEGVCV